MPPVIQDTLLDLFERVRQDPDTLPTMPIKDWQEGSVEWNLLSGFHAMLEQVQQRVQKFKEMEQQLREKEEQYRVIFEATIDGLSINDLEDGRVIEANPALCRMFGYTYEEFIDLPPNATIHPDTYHVVADVLQKVQAGTAFGTRFIGLRKDGSSFHAEGRGTPFIYKGKPHLLGSTRDITEQVQAEEQLREREEQYRSIFEAVTDSLTISSLEEGQVVEANPATCKMLRYSYEELIGKLPAELVPPDYLPVVTEGLQTLRAGGRNDLLMLTLRKDGSTFPTEVHSTLFNYKGKPHLLTVSRDITERVQAEEQLREKEEQYRSVFEATDDGLNIADLDGFYVEANPAYCKMLGFTREELMGMHYSQSTFPEYYPVLEESARTIGAGGQYQTQGLARRKNGSPLPVEAHAKPFIYKGKPHILGVMRDITERVEAEKQLHEKEEQYRSIFEATYDGLIISNLNGFVVEVNPAFCHMYGYTRDELIGLHVGALASPDSLPALDEVLEMRKTGRNYQTVVAQAMRKDGTAFYVESHGTTFTYKGQPHTLGVVRDISERIEAEQQLREKEEQYRSIFEATSDGLIIRDLNGFAVEANPAACKMHGYSYEEFIGLPRSAIVHPQSHAAVAAYIKTIQEGQTFLGQAFDVRKDGSTFPVEVRGSTFMYLGQPHMLTVLRDITDRVEAEKQLREKEEQYRAVFEATTDGLVILDPDAFYVEANPAMCSLFGYTHEELIGLQTSALTAPESLDILAESMEKIKGGERFQAEGLALRKNGTTFYAEAYLTPFTYQGKPHLLAATHDITERVQAQQLLEQRVEERTRELSSLLEISHTVASTLQLSPLLGLILDQLKTVVDYTGAAILAVEGKDLIILDNRSPIQEVQLMQLHFPLKDLGPIWDAMISRETIIMPDVRDDTNLAQAFRAALGELGETTFSYVQACMVVPLSLKEQVIGMLVLTSSKKEAFTPHHSVLALAIANQAAVAIENAWLYERAQALAAVEERQRLARELHDSVSQALYGISLGVHTARMQLDRNPNALAESLDYVLELAEAALIEMRALIFELRPESLEIEGLVTALTKQAAALHARQGIIVQLELGKEPDVSLKMKQDLYRIAQEALHNTVKHARASQVVLRLDQSNDIVTMEVCDDGRGFDATVSFPGHLGLHSMRERVANLGGTFQVKSVEGQGTMIRVLIPAQGPYQK